VNQHSTETDLEMFHSLKLTKLARKSFLGFDPLCCNWTRSTTCD